MKRFSRVDLRPGERKHIVIQLDPRSFAYFDTKNSAWQADAGAYTLSLGSSVSDIAATIAVQLPRTLQISMGSQLGLSFSGSPSYASAPPAPLQATER